MSLKIAPLQFTGFSDLDIMAKTVWGEARGEEFAGQVAVASVIRNRASRPGWWGKDLPSVCLAPSQFSCWNAKDPNRHLLMDLGVENPAYLRALGISALVVTGDLADPTLGADHYHATAMSPYPAWAVASRRLAQVGGHLFYRL